ncbi:PP2C family protein-serine/threonine phosphatase [Streptomyces pathocidini]|uniref:PP2C family protein-serine/threonine phosphatase n=1 Tax=Streptomyces pathocidini TaxID=1650571 RepID=A0ABW7UU30_9ACTN|nr:PP2C family protein-serine/threonine phosphatase [Streptomyces pathocidini]
MGSPTEWRGTAGRAVVRRLKLLPAVIIVAGVLIDYFTPPDFSGAALYSAAPMAGAPVLSLPALILTGLAACGADIALLAHFGYWGPSGGYSELSSVVIISALAVLINRLLYRSDVRLQSARTIALAVQRAVLPEPPPRVGPMTIAARYTAAHEGAQIGGDLYAVQDTPYGVRCIVGDVRGKGLNAVEAVDIVLGTFREAAEEEPTLAELAARLDRALTRESKRRANLDDVEGFTTAVLAEIPYGGEELRLFNRGHPGPLVLLDGAVRYVEPSQPELPLGLAVLCADRDRADTVPFPEGATLLLYTDGLSEARDRDGAFYDPVARLTGRRFASPDALLDLLLDEVGRHTDGLTTDDMALLALTRGPRFNQMGEGASRRTAE